MEITEKELEKRLFDAGNKLSSISSSISEIISSLDLVENLLAVVEQSPTKSMKEALAPLTKALVAEELMRHSDVDVKVAVASCISEITRITAPDAPYEDDKMKEVFQLIVSSFEKLDDKSSRSYTKRICILQTVAKIRSCVVMLDLECDDLIVEMFQLFFRTIRDDHHDIVFSSMETIMTLVVDESEDIPLDLVSSILNVLKKDFQKVKPIAYQLGEKVFVKCASRLKDYLLPAIRSAGASLNDYSKAVTDAYQFDDEAFEPISGDAPKKIVVEENNSVNAPSEKGDETNMVDTSSEKAVEVALETPEDTPPSKEVGPSDSGSYKTITTDGTLQKDKDNTVSENDNSTQGEKVESSETVYDSVGTEEPPKCKPEHNTVAANDNSKEAVLDTHGEKVESSETVDDSVGTEGPPKCKPEHNTVAANDNSKEADLDSQGVKVESSETVDDSVGTVELPKCKPDHNIVAANDNSKEADLDTQGVKVESSETVDDSVGTEEPPKCKPEHDTFAANDNSKEEHLHTQSVKVESSETIDDSLGTDEPPKCKPEQEKPSGQNENMSNGTLQKDNDNTVAANDNSKEADLDTQGEKVVPSEIIADTIGTEELPNGKPEQENSSRQEGQKPNSTKSSPEPLNLSAPDNKGEDTDKPEHQDDAILVDNIRCEDPVVDTVEAGDHKKSSGAPVPSPKTPDNEFAGVTSACPSVSLADGACSKQTEQGEKREDRTQESETVSDVDSEKESDMKSECDSQVEKEGAGSENKMNSSCNEKAPPVSDPEESAPDSASDTKSEHDNEDELDGNSAQDLAQDEEIEDGDNELAVKKNLGQTKPTPAKSSKKSTSWRKAPPVSDSEESAPDSASDTKSEHDNEDELDGNSAQDLAQDEDVEDGDNQLAVKKKLGQMKPTPAKSNKKSTSSKKAPPVSDSEESEPDSASDPKSEHDNEDELDGNSAQDLAGDQDIEDGDNQLAVKKKLGQKKPTTAKSRKKKPTKDKKKKTVAETKSTPKVPKYESDMEESLSSSLKRKRTSYGKESKTKVYGEDLVGATVRVWWPKDREFYQGVVASFNLASKKHTIVYDDGDVEILNLEEEKWQLINLSEGCANSDDAPDEFAGETRKGKKAKTIIDLEAKRGKFTSPARKSGASSSRSKAVSKSGSKYDSAKIAEKPEETSKKGGKSDLNKSGKSTKGSKTGGKLMVDAPKSAAKSKDDNIYTPKGSTKSKPDTSKGAPKSKGKTPKSLGKSSAGGSGKLRVATPTNQDYTEDESLEPETTPEKPKRKFQSAPKSQNSLKKRKS